LSFVALLLALLGSIVYGSITTLVRTKSVIESGRVGQRTAEALITRISRELENRYAEPLRSKNAASQAGASSAGATTTAPPDDDAAPLLVGRTRRVQGVSADSIRLVTLGNPASTEMGNPGLIEVQYSLQSIPNTADTGSLNPGSLYTGPMFSLVREEGPANVEDQKTFDARTFRQVLSDKVRSLQFRYRFNRRWVNQWSTKRETFPDAVEITLSMASEGGGSQIYRTAVSIYRADE